MTRAADSMRQSFARWSRALAVALAAAGVLAGAVSAQTIDPDTEGFNPMRQITSQFLSPNLMIVFDRSGSLSFPVVQVSGEDFGASDGNYWYEWRFRDFDGDRSAYAHMAADWTVEYDGLDPHMGVGQGFWLKVGSQASVDFRATHSPLQGYLRERYDTTVYALRRTNLSRGDTVRISGSPSDDGIYRIRTDPRRSSWNRRYEYFEVERLLPDGSWEGGAHEFSLRRDTAISVVEGELLAGGESGTSWYFVPPSRIAILKNALGPHVRIYEPSVTPSESDPDGKPVYTFDGTDAGPVNGAYFDWSTREWVNWAPGSGHEPVGDPAYTRVLEPEDLVGATRRTVNWGLVAFNDRCGTQHLEVGIDPDDNDARVARIQALMDTVANGGLNPSGGTPTRAGLDRVMDEDALPSTFRNDSKRVCGRTYAVMLITDGESNNCNPDNESWGSCPSSWESYPAGKTEQLWNLDWPDGAAATIRTFVIGVSPDVGRCELNYTAFRGRTDASSPNGDGGFETAHDPRLPDLSDGNAGNEYDGASDYAYFAETSAEFKEAVASILAALGVGDYTTSAPSVVSTSSSAGLTGFVSSASYPSWRGHFYAYDLRMSECLAAGGTLPAYCSAPCGSTGAFCLWDAGEVLSLGGLRDDGTRDERNNGEPRRIFTWNPDSDYGLVEIDLEEDVVTALDALCGGCGFTEEVADFVLGNDGQGNPRSWQLGAIINSTPAVIGPPEAWQQGNLEAHASFEQSFQDRHSLVWIGSSDGMMHAFDSTDGAEIVALLPPDLLAKQVDLYANFLRRPADFATGQPKLPRDHIYGVANSPRFADVWHDGEYRTALFLTEGLGGTGIHAIDVTHPFPGRDLNGDGDQDDPGEAADPSYGSGPGLSVWWSRTRDGKGFTGALVDLGWTTSVPAIGSTGARNWELLVGGGYDDTFTASSVPVVYRLNPVSGAISRAENLTDQASGALVRNQSFADSVIWQTDARAFAPDNMVDQGVQVDLQGQLWVFEPAQWRADRLINVGAGQPLYYPPAVAAYPSSAAPTHRLYAFSSGTLYEESPNVTGPDVGSSGHFIPKVYVAAATDTSVTTRSLPLENISTEDGTLGPHTQVTAPPLIFVPRQGSASLPFALFLVYDPDADTCAGRSYIVWLEFDPESMADTMTASTYDAGLGAAAGFAVAGDKVVVSRSEVGHDARATLVAVPDLTIQQGGLGSRIRWWRELR